MTARMIAYLPRVALMPSWFDVWQARRMRRTLPTRSKAVAKGKRRLFCDVSVIAAHDAGTGIQRVVRAVASELQQIDSPEWEIHFVGAKRKDPYHVISWPTGSMLRSRQEVMSARPGDVFFGLDFALDATHFHRRQLLDFRRQGGALWFMMHDLLPIRQPGWFSETNVARFKRWFSLLAGMADGFFCNSSVTETDLCEELTSRYGIASGFRTQVLPMGWDIAASRPSTGVPEGFGALLERIARHPTALMVGTIEPRKGHDDVLAAFDILWQQGHEYNLVIVGRPGWKTEGVQNALRKHPLRGTHLFWLDNASDEAVTKLYEASDGVIVASRAEGYGLPLVEALGYGKPVLARDIPVFRLHEKRGVRYFAADSEPAAIARAIDDCLKSAANGITIAGADIPTWADTARCVLATLAEEGA